MRIFLIAAAIAAGLPSVAVAHHGWSAYEEAKPVTITGRLSDVRWANPHGTAKLKWQNKQWDVVLAPIARMEARGLTEADIAKGQPVTLTGYLRRDGTAELRIERIRLGEKTVELR